MNLRLVRLRQILRSRPVALGLAAIALWSTLAVVQRAEATRHNWGERRSVVRATRDLPVGTRIGPADLSLVELPQGMAGTGTTADVETLIGRRVVAAVHAGDFIIAPRTRRLLSPVASRVAAGHRGVSLPTDDRLPTLRIGDLVSVVDPAQPAVAIDATVIDITDDSVTVDAQKDDAITIANAVVRNSVAVLLRGPS